MTGCTCEKCVEMCLTYPCMPLAEEAEKLISAGYGPLLALDTLNSWFDGKGKILALRPAMVGLEHDLLPCEIGKSPCVFLKNERCLLHDLGLKPYEGRECLHNTTFNQEMKTVDQLKKSWSTEKAQELVMTWVEKYYTGTQNVPTLLRTINER